MIRIVICSGSQELAQGLFERARDALRGRRLNCELSCCTRLETVRGNLAKDPQYYDVLILDALDPPCLELAGAVRSKNLTASLIFAAAKAPNIHSILKFRPSACVAGVQDTAALGDALLYCCGEQLRFRPYFTVKNKDMLLKINYNDILYFESRLRVAVMHTKRQTVEFYAKLGDVLPRLPPSFIRCHQSYIVSMDQVRQLDKTSRRFLLTSGESIEISKSRYGEIAQRYESYAARH